ncbi:unnamed protein product [Adineta ricciae]|uniref:Uncharacterized protein n=1 Tax=Adineta ricciae TaxID=249248 RepID=A0A814QU91_ADIRI|nr:unnamed protein product [Adineta ricciae]CAF1124348.1 unnamed protein product [Adineta ricciae]
MNHHRLVQNLGLIFILTYPISSIAAECSEHSSQDDIPFGDRVNQAPIILLGTSLNKNIDSHIPNLFNVTFLVQCILKGRPTQRVIYIVQAGSLLGRRSCQRLDVNREYLVFLEPFFDGTYRPVDLEEILYTNQVNMLLSKTCGLSRTYPFTESNDSEALLTNKCPPAVSINCPTEPPKSTVKTATVTSVLPSTTSTANADKLTKTPLDMEAISLLLAEHPYENLSFALLQNQNHKSLFSDDETRKNHGHRMSSMLFLIFIQLIFGSILH